MTWAKYALQMLPKKKSVFVRRDTRSLECAPTGASQRFRPLIWGPFGALEFGHFHGSFR
jgi:hypothetical protein